MNNKDLTKPAGIFTAMFILGLTIAIYIQTGVNINPEDQLINVGDIIVKQIGDQFSIYWTIFTIMVAIIGFLSLICSIYLIYLQGYLSIIIAISGVVSGITLLFKPTVYVGVFFLIIGGLLVRFLE